tara:strand:- start:1600 stop:2466 length:867 start_codon:yes stop_codon:yes gene_type:complete
MRLFLTGLIFFITLPSSFGQGNPNYKLYRSNGKEITYKKLIKELNSANIILLGEIHNNPIVHWLTLEISKSLNIKNNLILGSEIFERDNEEFLQQYLNELIDYPELDSLARLWSNFETDYKPLVDYARYNSIKFVSTNIPRRYASLVYKNGFSVLENLTITEKKWISPLPIKYDSNLPGYQNMINMIPGHVNVNFPKAQAIKDATMAYFILQNYSENKLFLHVNGSYHSDRHGDSPDGILWYLKNEAPTLKYLTISTVNQENVKKLEPENFNKADYLICIIENMTKTY